MQYELETRPLLAPLVAYTLRESWVDVVLISDELDLDDATKDAIAKDLIADMDSTGRTYACLVSVP